MSNDNETMSLAEQSRLGIRKPQFNKPAPEMVQELIAANNRLTSELTRLASQDTYLESLTPVVTDITKLLAEVDTLFTMMAPHAFEGDNDHAVFLRRMRESLAKVRKPLHHHELQLKNAEKARAEAALLEQPK